MIDCSEIKPSFTASWIQKINLKTNRKKSPETAYTKAFVPSVGGFPNSMSGIRQDRFNIFPIANLFRFCCFFFKSNVTFGQHSETLCCPLKRLLAVLPPALRSSSFCKPSKNLRTDFLMSASPPYLP